MRKRKRLAVFSIVSYFVVVSSLFAEGQKQDEASRVLAHATTSGVKNISKDSVESCWADWLKQQSLSDGKNDHDGHLILISHQQQAIQQEPNARSWLSARKAAFQTAELTARAALADTMKTEIKASRSTAQQLLGGDDAPSNLKEPVQQLSIADKANVLVDKALDNEILKYDPAWKQSATPEEKKEALTVVQSRLQDNIAAHSELFAAGAFTVVQCEGRSTEDSGKYSVLVGMIWSAKLAKIAESIWNPASKLPPDTPQSTVAAQFEAFKDKDPDWLAYTMGARVFTNEKGERVIVGFGTVPQSSMMSVDKRRASLEALAAIQHFVGEKVEANQESSDSFEYREQNNGEANFFDTSAFNSKVAARSQDLQLRGTAEIASWRGEHPWSNAKMQVVAVAWTPSWAADSEQAAAMMHAIEKRMNGQGAVPEAPTKNKKKYKGAGAAAPAHAGASSSARDF